MKTSRFREIQILKILKQQEAGVKTVDVCREHGISQATFYGWKAKYSGMEAQTFNACANWKPKNLRLKRMFADLSLEHQILKEGVEKSFKRRAATGVGGEHHE